MACGGGSSAQTEPWPKQADAAAFQKLMQQHPEAVVLDVRTSGEIAKGMIAGARHMDYNSRILGNKPLRCLKTSPCWCIAFRVAEAKPLPII